MKTILTLVGLGAFALGCHSEPPRELLDARAAYQRAQENPGAARAASDLHDAQVALTTAEKKFEDDGDSQETKDSAYIAQRRAVGANAKANAFQSLEQKKMAEAELAKFKDNMAVATRAQLGATKGALANAQSQAESERSARADADRRAMEALDKIAGLKSQQSDRGLVLTLSGSVLFATGKSELLPNARGRLNDVARALKEDQRNITIVGHTDSQGADDMNMKLSQARADSVRSYLTSKGVPGDRVRAEGLGKTQPMADNATAEGRANNRRVEIILENASGGSKPSTNGGTPTP
jgi:outer membrane protein OmpA-like peptidoglycan-associated protein